MRTSLKFGLKFGLKTGLKIGHKSGLVPGSILPIIVMIVALGIAQASTVVIPSDDELIIGARAIVRGFVISSVSGYDERNRGLFTYTTIDVRQVLKGNVLSAASSEIVIKEPGGISGNLGTFVYGVPQFTPREEVLLYLDTWPDGSLRVYHWYMGKFTIVANKLTGRQEISREATDPMVRVKGRSTRGVSTDQSDLYSYLTMVSSRLPLLYGQSVDHENQYFKGNPINSLPIEVPSVESLSRSPNYTLINPYQPLRWFEPDEGRPIIFSMNSTGMPNGRMSEDIRAAMQVWSTVANTSVRLVLGGQTSTCGLSNIDGVNTISFNNCDQYSSFSPPVRGGCAGVLAAAGISNFDTTQRKTIGGILFHRAIEGNLSFNPYANCYFTDPCNVREIATHEFGHALGLGHSKDPDASMYAIAHLDGRCGSVRADDEAGIRFIYPTALPSGQSPTITTVSLPQAQAESAYEFNLSAGSGTAPYQWKVIGGALPQGITMTSTGSLRGISMIPGDYAITFQVTDSLNQYHQKTFVMTVRPKPTGPPPNPVISDGGLQFFPLTVPVRWYDTRSPNGTCNSPRAPLNSFGTAIVTVRGACFNANIPATARAVVGQATIINLSRNQGTYQIIAAGANRSATGSIAYKALQTLTTTFTTPLSQSGALEVITSNQSHVVIEIIGYYAPPAAGGLYFHPIPNSIRLIDTQAAAGACSSYLQPLGTGSTHAERATVKCNGVVIPASAKVIIGNATVTNVSSSIGFVTIYRSGVSRPNATSLNAQVGETVSNQIFTGIGREGVFSTYTSTKMNLSFDVMGYFSSDESDFNGAGLLFYPLNGSMRLIETRLSESGCYSYSRPLNAKQEVTISARLTCNGIQLPNNAETITGYSTVVNQSQLSGSLLFYPSDQPRPITANMQYASTGSTPNAFTVRLGVSGSFKFESANSVNLYVDVLGYFAP